MLGELGPVGWTCGVVWWWLISRGVVFATIGNLLDVRALASLSMEGISLRCETYHNRPCNWVQGGEKSEATACRNLDWPKTDQEDCNGRAFSGAAMGPPAPGNLPSKSHGTSSGTLGAISRRLSSAAAAAAIAQHR
ncbi:hypothetical protein B0T17DRAFT_502082 [Bombardia bombarda]|uniref:Uncharacterized protein n=1 Tax=Bombardia bombarda TaxID=252184 RepID=A0AA39XIW4_9PEZI|nr:hypothetical protein B0T17DRAFT_502082 [Bombardia bombarda]